MIAILILYKWAILAGVAMAPALALLGCHLAARDKAMQTLCIGQGATLGVLVTLGTLMLLGAGETLLGVGPFVGAALFSFGTFVLTESIAQRRKSSRNTYFSTVFCGLLALGYLVCALFPPLENHMSQVFFGDLATLSDVESVLCVALGLLVAVFLARYWRSITRQSFNQAIFGEFVFRRENGISPRAFSLVALVVLCFSVQFLGFLFTASCLFVPTAAMTALAKRGIRKHFFFCGALAAVATLAGFGLSLEWGRLPTVPTIVVLMLAITGATLLVRRFL